MAEAKERLGTRSRTIYSVTNEGGLVPSLEQFGKQVFSKDTSRYKLVRSGDLAYNPSRINVGSIAICHDPEGAAVSPMYVVVRCRPTVLPKYLLYYLKSAVGLAHIRHRCEGAVRFQLKFRDMQEIPIYLPSVRDQERAVEVLDHAENLRRLRYDTERRSADVVPALFHNMLGDPAANPKGWPVIPLGQLAMRITKGESPRWQGVEYSDSGVAFITSENVGWGILDPMSVRKIPLEFHKKLQRSALQEGDVLVNLVGASIGRTCVVPEGFGDGNVNQAVAVITPAPGLDSVYLCAALLTAHSQRVLHEGKVDAARANISLTNLRKLPLPVPPLALQHRFADLVSEVRRLQEKQVASRVRLDDLHRALLHRAFTGSL